MRRIDAELREVDRQLEQIIGKAAASSEPGGSGALLPLWNIPELVALLANLTREVMVQEKVRSFLSSQLEEARIQETRDLEVIHVLDEAVPPLKKSRPRRSLMVILTVALAFIGSVGTAFVADSFLGYVRDSGPDSEFASSRESKVLLRVARVLRDWGGPRQDEGSS